MLPPSIAVTTDDAPADDWVSLLLSDEPCEAAAAAAADAAAVDDQPPGAAPDVGYSADEDSADRGEQPPSPPPPPPALPAVPRRACRDRQLSAAGLRHQTGLYSTCAVTDNPATAREVLAGPDKDLWQQQSMKKWRGCSRRVSTPMRRSLWVSRLYPLSSCSMSNEMSKVTSRSTRPDLWPRGSGRLLDATMMRCMRRLHSMSPCGCC